VQVGAGDEPLALVDGADFVGGKPEGREGYAVTALPGGDFVVRVRHRSAREVRVTLVERRDGGG
jgi:hypothetical protein